MVIISVDLGTTNIKAAAFDRRLAVLGSFSRSVEYQNSGDRVEFSPEDYFDLVLECIRKCVAAGGANPDETRRLVLTGQAESLVMLDRDGRPARAAISWLDMRSSAECEVLSREYPPDVAYEITGQPAIIPTWPITKMLWLRSTSPPWWVRW